MAIHTSFADFGRGRARYHCMDSAGPQLHFAHANGLPFATYRTFLELFADTYTVCGMDNRGAWPAQPAPRRGYDWYDHADDLVAFLEQQYDEPVIAIGHSIGGSVSLFAAERRPELFRALVLIDPATSPNKLLDWLLRLTPRMIGGRIQIIRKTRERRRHWESRDEFIAHHRTRRAFRDFTEEALRDYADGGLEDSPDGRLKLVFDPAWEAYNFLTTPYIWDALSTISVPTLLLSAEHTYLHDRTVLLHHAKRFADSVEYQILEGLHHLAPQQDPAAVASIVTSWLSSRGTR
ncbi:MAG: alpha/beta hydrolase [Gammaproteobacteria bacterium]|nr:alpha/beta hydrolase [Gammaproteobacteria bacterium]